MARRDDGGRDALFESAPLATSSERPLPFPGFRPVGDLVDVGRFSKMGFVPPFHGDRSLYTEELKRLFNPDPNSPPRASRSQIGHGSQVGQDLLDAASPSKNEYELFGSKRDDFVLSSGLLTESLQDFYRASFRTPPDQRVTMMTSASSRENGDVSPRVAVALQHASVLFPVPPPPLNYPTPTPPAVLSAARGVCDNNAASYPRGGLAGGVPGHGVAEPLSPAALLQDAVEQQRHRLRFCSNGSCSSGSSDAAADDFVLNGTDSDLDLMDLTQMRRRKRVSICLRRTRAVSTCTCGVLVLRGEFLTHSSEGAVVECEQLAVKESIREIRDTNGYCEIPLVTCVPAVHVFLELRTSCWWCLFSTVLMHFACD